MNAECHKDQTLLDAVNLALHHEMKADERVVLLGEDIGKNGGVFRATQGLQQAFGHQRVLDTPLAETSIAGAAVGMAAAGLRPVAEIQFMGFIFAAMEHLVTHAARLRNRTRGRLSCPLVVRAPFGGGIHAPEHHSESTEALFAHIPGLRVVVPSSPLRAYRLLLAAIRNPDPVIFLEPKRIYRTQKQDLLDDGEELPLDTCFTLHEGSDITVITWGACVQECARITQTLAEKGVGVELIDLATISPIDFKTIEASVKKTGRCLIVHEAPKNCGVGAEIAAWLAEHSMQFLRAPIRRLAGFDTIMPYFRNEHHYMITEADVEAAIMNLLQDDF